jgi:imidazolonepropionase-like amidohydrolase
MKKVLALNILWYLALPPSLHSEVIAIRAGRVLDPEAGTTATNAIVLVEDGRIKAIGAGLSVPPGATVIDLAGSTVLPGLFDCHTHVCLAMEIPAKGGARPIFQSLLLTSVTRSTGYRALQGLANAQSMLRSGFTTIRDLGNAGNYADVDLRRAIEDGLVSGPNIINAGRIIVPYGGQFPGLVSPEKRDLGEPEYFYADTRDELLRAVRENVYYGAKVIKVVVDDQPYIYSVDDLRLVVDEAAKAGQPLVPTKASGYRE